jgi:hypothetical protein
MLAGVIDTIQAVAVDAMTRRQLEAAIAELQSVESAAVARRLDAMAALDGLGDGGLPSESVARSAGKSSARKAKRDRKTAEALREMPKTAQKLAAGEITAEHAEAIAEAAERVGDAATVDAELSTKADVPADLFSTRAREYADKHESRDKAEARAQRQRRNRKAIFGNDKTDGSWSLYATTDTSEGRELRGLIDAEADRLFRDDGGRDNPVRDRTDDQRRFDALANLIRRGASGGAALTGRPHHRFQGVVSIPLASYLDPEHATGELIGTGPLPRAVVQRILCDAGLDLAIVDPTGNPLWAGRNARTVTAQQWRSLVVRDGGCVICGADPTRCEAHHIIWWSHGGPTDITNLVLLCTHHHHQLHDHELTLARRNGTWHLQPRARPGPEPPGHPRRQRRQGRSSRSSRDPAVMR